MNLNKLNPPRITQRSVTSFSAAEKPPEGRIPRTHPARTPRDSASGGVQAASSTPAEASHFRVPRRIRSKSLGERAATRRPPEPPAHHNQAAPNHRSNHRDETNQIPTNTRGIRPTHLPELPPTTAASGRPPLRPARRPAQWWRARTSSPATAAAASPHLAPRGGSSPTGAAGNPIRIRAPPPVARPRGWAIQKVRIERDAPVAC